MWFLRGLPTKLKVRGVVASVDNGYQHNNYRFCITADPERSHNGKAWVAIAFPWAPHKEDGGLRFLDEDLLSKYCQEDTVKISRDDVTLVTRFRSLKSESDIELVHVQDLINWYLEDFGVMIMWVEPEKTYQLNYSHKLAADSKLFFPTRLPLIISAKHPEMDYKLWVENGLFYELDKHVTRTDNLLTFKEWGWDDDTRIATDNWESSDDLSSSEE